jgi:hypothetical protein
MTTSHCPLDRVIRGTFEWREVANLLSSFRLRQPDIGCHDGVDRIVGECVYRTANALAHQRRDFAEFVVHLLDRVHAPVCCRARALPVRDVKAMVAEPLTAERIGWLWAFLTDPRPQVVRLAKCWAKGETVG